MTGTRLHSRPISGALPTAASGHGMAALTGLGRPLPGAACRDSDLAADTWFGGPEGSRQRDRDQADEWARAVCVSCPAIAACLGLALDRDERHGVFGGLTAAERAGARRGRRGRGALRGGLDVLASMGADTGALEQVVADHRAQGQRRTRRAA